MANSKLRTHRVTPLKDAFAIACILLTLCGCGTASVEDYQSHKPAFRPESFFDGALTAHGIVKDFSGSVIRHFSADIIACWIDGVGVLDEAFVFDDGERQNRVWTLTPNGDQRYIGTAGDVIGEGQAQWKGNAMFLDYILRIDLM